MGRRLAGRDPGSQPAWDRQRNPVVRGARPRTPPSLRAASLPVDVHADALDGLEEAAVWYEDRRPGLGFEFAAEIERVVASVAERPLAYRQWKREDPVRRALASRFPYAVFFDVEPQRIVLMAIAHSSRRPGYWGGRVKPPHRTPTNEKGP
jgi:toxin ParE1/3/4